MQRQKNAYTSVRPAYAGAKVEEDFIGMADREMVAAALTSALVQATAKTMQGSALTDKEQERIGLARQTVILYETILGMLPVAKTSTPRS